jgi:hypothetical protein
MPALPERGPDVDRRCVTRVPADPYLRFDTNDRSPHPALVGRRVEIRASQRKITAAALDTGELACSHERSFAKNHTVTALEHALALRKGREEGEGEMFVEQRPLTVYDPVDRMSASSELTHVFRAMKAPAVARALGKPAECARSEEEFDFTFQRSIK